MDAFKNFAISAVATAPSPASAGTSLVVTSGHGARFPAPPFNVTIWPSAALPDPTNAEIVRVTAIATDTLTITRAQESTSARTVVVGDLLAATITQKALDDLAALAGGGGGGSWLAPFTVPTLGAFAWVNQGTATGTAVGNRIVLFAPATAGESIRLLKQALPAAPYTVTACLMPNIVNTNYHGAGIMLRESSTGKLLGICTSFNASNQLRGYRWSNPTTFASQASNIDLPSCNPIWLRVSRSGTTLTADMSVDGYSWRTVLTEAITASFTTAPDEVGFFGNCGGTTADVSLSLLSWAVT
jgi:hypothetical protein